MYDFRASIWSGPGLDKLVAAVRSEGCPLIMLLSLEVLALGLKSATMARLLQNLSHEALPSQSIKTTDRDSRSRARPQSSQPGA